MFHRFKVFNTMAFTSCYLTLIYLATLHQIVSSATIADKFDHSSIGGYPLHEAMIASAYGSTSGRFSLDEMVSVLECSHGEEVVDEFKAAIPEIISKSLAKSSNDRGRVIEHSDMEFRDVSDNYYVSQSSVTLSCAVMAPLSANDMKGAAYASHFIASAADPVPADSNPEAYNVSMLMEAAVIELPVQGYMFLPSKYCLDVDDEYDFGITNPGLKDSIPGYAASEINRPISLGTKEDTLRSTFNRVTWLSILDKDLTDHDFIREAFEYPKIELLTVLDVMENKLCNHTSNGTLDEKLGCLKVKSLEKLEHASCTSPGWYDSRGLQYDCSWYEEGDNCAKYGNSFANFGNFTANQVCCPCGGGQWSQITDDDEFRSTAGAIENAMSQIGGLFNAIDDWRAWRVAENNIAEFDDDKLEDLEEQLKEQSYSLFPVPLGFEKILAYNYKTSPLGGFQINPYWPDGTLEEKVIATTEEEEGLFECVSQKSDDTSNEQMSAFNFPGSLKRRINEHSGIPLTKVSDWSTVNGRGGFPVTDLILAYNEKYLQQEVSWAKSFDGFYELQEGNLTENRTLGRHYNWLMTTDWEDSSKMQNLLKAQRNTKIHSKASRAAVETDNPCGQAASNTDIFLFALAIATAALGGVTQLLYGVHHGLHFWVSCSRRCNNRHQSDEYEATGWKKIIPTYEMFLLLLGIIVFVLLYLPLVLQLSMEYEVANYHTDAVDLEVLYADASVQQHGVTHATLVTLVHSETGCQEARPELLLWMFVGGLIIGILFNAPYIAQGLGALAYYFRRFSETETERTQRVGRSRRSSVTDAEPDILRPMSINDMNPLVISDNNDEEVIDNVEEVSSPTPVSITKQSTESTTEHSNEGQQQQLVHPSSRGVNGGLDQISSSRGIDDGLDQPVSSRGMNDGLNRLTSTNSFESTGTEMFA